MRRISIKDETLISDVIRQWPRQKFTWEKIREEIASRLGVDISQVWTRQAFGANETIGAAYENVVIQRRQKAEVSSATPAAGGNELEIKLLTSQAALAELQIKYNNLAMRHRQLLYNAAVLPGGTRLLIDPLPESTQSRSANLSGLGRASSRRKK